MEPEKISVIIPVYDSEKYLEPCVRSVLGQTYKNLEILLVDDGSADGSLALCEKFAAEDGRVSVIHRENGGAAAARNTGLDAATGDYIGFVDSNDYIAPDMYEKLHRALVEADADMSECDLAQIDGEGNTLTDFPPIPAGVRDGRQAMELVVRGEKRWRYISLVNRLYKRTLFEDYRLVEGKICEDEFAAYPLYTRCRRIAFISDVLYWYVMRENSVMTSPISVKRLAGVEAFLERCSLFRRQGWDDLMDTTVYDAYYHLWQITKNVDVREHREEIEPYIERVTEELSARGGLLNAVRAVRLRGLYRRRARRG